MLIRKLNYNDKKIFVVDNFFSCQEQIFFETFCTNSLYTPTSSSTQVTSDLFNHYLHCRLNKNDDKNFGLVTQKVYDVLYNLFPEFKLLDCVTSWINLTLPYGVYQTHTDHYNNGDDECSDKMVSLLYYATSNWNDSYNGHTLFFNYNDMSEAELAVSYKEGRMVIFDSTIPHKPSLSCNHKKPRYTYLAKFMNVNERFNLNEAHNGETFPIKTN